MRPEEIKQLSEKALVFLVPLAIKKSPPIAYGDLAEILDIIPRQVGRALGYMRDELLGPSYPLLNALVKYKNGRLPGPGWLRNRPGNLTREEEINRYEEEFEKVGTYKHWNKLIGRGKINHG